MNPKTTNMMCVILAIIIVILLGYAAYNKGKLWGEEQYRYQMGLSTSMMGSGGGNCPPGQNNIMGQCVPNFTMGNFSFPPLP
jgi:hypothetical protein